MKNLIRASGLACLGVLFSALALAAPPGKRQVTVSPGTVGSPLEAASAMRVCLSGFELGDYVSVPVPWLGTPESHDFLTSQNYVDASGSWCFTAPPDWATIELTPGRYTIEVNYYPHGNFSRVRRGPSVQFTVR